MTLPNRACSGQRSRPLVWGGIGALLITIAAGPALDQETIDPDRWTGCWDVEWGEWRPPIPDADTLLYRPPPRVQLTDAASPFPGYGRYHAQPAPGSLPTPHSVSEWRPVSGDSLWIQWSSGGLHGTLGSFSRRGDTLRGEIRTFADRSGAKRYRAAASLVRVSCAATPEVPATEAGPGLWFVPLEGGDRVHLGRLLPAQLIERPGEDGYRIAGTPTGIFAGARDVRAQLTRGGAVADLRFTYPRDASLDSIVAAFSDTLGAPTSRNQRRGRTRVLWHTDTNTLTLRRSGDDTWLFLGRPGADYGVRPEHVQKPGDDSTEADLR